MDKREIFSLLKDSPIFIGLSDDQIRFILFSSEVRRVSKLEYIIHEGEQGTELFIILKGRVEILKKDEATGVERSILVVEAVDSIGEMALIHRSPRSASVRTLEDTELLVIPFAYFSFFAKQNDPYTQIMINLSNQVRKRLRKSSP